MSNSNLTIQGLRGIDVDAAAAEFWLRNSSEVRQAAVINRPDDPISIPNESCSDTSIVPSAYRPPVLASERALLWTTPHGLSFQHALEQHYPESHIIKLFFVMAQSLDESTNNDYGVGLLRFTQFCDRLSIPEQDRMPASETLPVQSPSSTAENWLAGLRFWHVINGAQWHGERSECLRQVQRGLHRLAPPDSDPKHRPPITLEALIQLHQGLDLSSTFDVSVLAIASLAFWCGCRLEELVIPAPDSFDITKHVTRSVLPIAAHDSDNVQHSTFHIPWTKTTGTNGVDINITARNHPTCPHAALFRHIKANPNIPSHAPLFSFETYNSTWTPMTEPWFLDRCNQIWVASGHPHMPGHKSAGPWGFS
ncbi:uncharacterized protein EDB91DRAFT_1145215 [Suillus paluster]|uniref:uncharacterized protein n=1 Tax=Suillus paluster TaxID=48578 RepID=UPI001B862C0F|nr:uncharacterized protein EDB91DRAFT_1145215 [Suillus paluster]KAG1735099.1 hypothetical protein EDB91DRAFT_1145215 [Suillus paluster]